MSKSKQKRQTYNDPVIQELKNRYGFTRQYIVMSIRGERTGTICIQIQEEYKKLDKASKQAITKTVNEL